MAYNLWILDGDEALRDPQLLNALERLPSEVVVERVPWGEAARFWKRRLPNALLFGVTALSPSHPIVMRASRDERCNTILVTTGWAGAAHDPDVDRQLSLRAPLSRISALLQKMVGSARPAPLRITIGTA